MDCPFCGKAMEPGHIYGDSGRRITWYPEGEHQPRVYYSLKSSLKHGGVPLSTTGYDTVFSSDAGSRMEAHICRSCGKGVFSIPPFEEVNELF